ncbi:putative inactive lipase [Corynebacterium capitovis DSM 44611]|uniref:lipase family protein n=1 Tax=Corynebacterium capitovis TaxID=131081 RepID=UPI0003672E7A|nr:lipase family protein [Corynebacterium capitovis]WKD58146.1 putative inactive lipase [Corynebacterium capitovis DSM 44611]
MSVMKYITHAAVSVAAAATFVAPAPASAQSSVDSLSSGIEHAATTPAGSLLAGYDPFYDDPVPDLGSPGTLLRSQAAPHLLNILGPDFPGYAERILYTSTTVTGDPVATSGFVIQPATQWAGPGPTPTVVFAPGTRGSSDACAPSRGPGFAAQVGLPGPAAGINYELHAYEAAAALGMRVVVVDYIGLGTPGAHTYVLHDEEGHAVLDAARAVVSAGDPVAFYGYSQGGGASAAAAELQPTYAPELNVKGTFAGAPPADLLATMTGVENSSIVAVLGYAINGWAARYPELAQVVDENVNPRGRELVAATANSCIPDDVLRWGLTNTASLTTSGQSLSDIVFSRPDIAAYFESQKLGRRTPTSPIMVSTAGSDDLVPSEQARQLARDYCAAGATTTMLDEGLPALTPGIKLGGNHVAGVLTELVPSMTWVVDRFNGVPAGSNCGQF